MHTVSDSQPAAAETLPPLAQGKQALVRDILRKLDRDTLEPLEGIRMMMDVKRVDSLDGVCAIYNRLAGIERQRERARRRGVRHGWLAISTSTPAPAPEGADPRFALDSASELDAEGVEVEIRRHLSQRYHRFVSQAVNNMEFGRGKPTTGFPGLWHVSAGGDGGGELQCILLHGRDRETDKDRRGRASRGPGGVPAGLCGRGTGRSRAGTVHSLIR